MLRTLRTFATRTTYNAVQNCIAPLAIPIRTICISAPRSFVQQQHQISSPILKESLKPYSISIGKLLQCEQPVITQNRSVTKFSLKKGKRKTAKSVIKRFKRLNWGIWIRTRSGRNKKLFKKSNALKKRLRQHVFVNATQSWLLDKMVTKFWRRPKYYIDDPYEPYHEREEYFATRKQPVKYD